MNCEQVQPNLLDYSRNLLKGPEYVQVRAHVSECAECAALLSEETAFDHRLECMPDEQPRNDVWILLRSRTRPKTVRPLVWLHGLVATNARKAATALVLSTVLGFAIHNATLVTTAQTQPERAPRVAVYTDDPLGGHTDAVIDSIDDM